MTGSFERKFLFPLVRILCVLFIVLCIGGIAFSTVNFMKAESVTAVPYSEVKAAMNSPKTGNASTGETKPTIPPNVQKYTTGNNSKVLESWLTNLNQEQKDDFLLNMSEVIESAERNNDNVPDAINAYKNLKFKKLATSEFEKTAAKMKPMAYGVAAATMLILITLFSIVLVLLSIERNTRREIRTDDAIPLVQKPLEL